MNQRQYFSKIISVLSVILFVPLLKPLKRHKIMAIQCKENNIEKLGGAFLEQKCKIFFLILNAV